MATDAGDQEVQRQELHWRRIDLRGFRRSDGLLEVEARLTDRKAHDFSPPSGGRQVAAGDAIHDHGLRVVFGEDMVIREVATAIRAYPYRECPGGGDVLQALVGVRIGPGWNAELRKRLPSGEACTHLKELMVPVASAAFQTVYSTRTGHVDEYDAAGRPRKIDSCHAYRAGGELVALQWPAFHRPETPPTGEDRGET